MKNNGCKKGFTLIELLVVVLIIGILAAIALPKYQKVAERAKAMQAIVLLKAVADAEERFYLTNGSYTTSLAVLDISLLANYRRSSPVWKYKVAEAYNNGEWSLEFSEEGGPKKILILRPRGQTYAGAGFYRDATTKNGRIFCTEIKKTSSWGNPSFAKADGAYCEKVMHSKSGDIASRSSHIRLYELPNN